MNRFFSSVFVLLSVTLLVLPVSASSITYEETFSTGAGYSNWTTLTTGNGTWTDTVVGGLLQVNGVVPQQGLGWFSTSITSQDAFGRGDFGDDVTVSADLGDATGAISWDDIGIRVGNIVVKYIPGYDAVSGNGYLRLQKFTTEPESAGLAEFPQRTMTGYTPLFGSLAQHMTVNAIHDAVDGTWDITATISEGGTQKFTTTFSEVGDSVVGSTLTRVGFVAVQGGTQVAGATNFNHTYDNLQVMMTVPEPASLAIFASGLVGLLCYAWRKRK